MWEKFKSYLADDTTFFSLLLLLVGVLAFGLGRQSVVQTDVGPPTQQTAGITLFQATSSGVIHETYSNTVVVVSKSGTKYHLLDCPGAKQIKESNKVHFDSTELAETAGYTAAANCPGLK